MKQVIVLSGKGGTGKTSVTAALAGLGPKKVLADCDVDASDLHLVLQPEILETHDFYSGKEANIDPEACVQCGLCREHCTFGAIDENFAVSGLRCEGCGVCAYICPEKAATLKECLAGQWHKSSTRFGPMIHAALHMGEENSGKLVTTVRNQATDLATEKGLPMVLIDGSPGIGCPVIASLAAVDLALIVTEPTISALHDMERLLSLLAHFKIPAMCLVNKWDINPDKAREVEALCKERNVILAGRLPYDGRVTQAQIAGKTVVEYDPEGLGQQLKDVWRKMEAHLFG